MRPTKLGVGKKHIYKKKKRTAPSHKIDQESGAEETSPVSHLQLCEPKFGDESLCQESLIGIFGSQPQSFAELAASTELVDAVLPPEKNGYHATLLHYQPGAPHHKET